jgi:short-subunit dehydrogenase
VVADVADRAALQKAARRALDEYGRIDTWVNDAGVSIYGRLDEVSDEDSRRLFETNFWGVVNGSLIALPYLRAEGGALINVGREVSDAVVPLQGMYSASKHAVKGFTDALRVEIENVDEGNVSVTLIQPTAVDTPYPQHAANYMDREPKLPTPQVEAGDVAKAILKAAQHPQRDVRVGAMAVPDTIASKVAPTLADAMSAKQVGRQQYDEPPRNPSGTLYTAGEGGRTKGSGGRTAA